MGLRDLRWPHLATLWLGGLLLALGLLWLDARRRGAWDFFVLLPADPTTPRGFLTAVRVVAAAMPLVVAATVAFPALPAVVSLLWCAVRLWHRAGGEPPAITGERGG